MQCSEVLRTAFCLSSVCLVQFTPRCSINRYSCCRSAFPFIYNTCSLALNVQCFLQYILAVLFWKTLLYCTFIALYCTCSIRWTYSYYGATIEWSTFSRGNKCLRTIIKTFCSRSEQVDSSNLLVRCSGLDWSGVEWNALYRYCTTSNRV